MSTQEATVGQTRIVAVTADLTEQAVDAIVNAANVHLKHGGGVAGAIARTGGPDIQRESDDWVDEHGPLAEGQAAVTGAGRLPATAVIHVAGPVYEEGSDRNERHLRAAVRGALAAAADRGLASIAFPAISAGIYGYPPDEATRVIADEVVRFARTHAGSLREVRLVGIDEKTARLFAEGLQAATA